MTPNSYNSAAEVFRRFAGMFGSDAVARKFGEAIPEEWTAMLSRLNEFQIQRGVRMLAYSGKAHVPSLPEFVKLCRDTEHDREVSDRPALKPPDVNPWVIAGNQQLLRHITTQIPKDPRRYGAPGSPEHERNVHVLVALKNRWVELMVEAATADGVPVDDQRQCWEECMRMAEEQIAKKEAA